MGISFIWVLILGVGIIFFPESPRYDYRHGRVEQAKRTMTKLYGVSDNHRVVAEELAEIKEKHEEELLHQGEKWWKMFTGPRMLYRIALGVALQVSIIVSLDSLLPFVKTILSHFMYSQHVSKKLPLSQLLSRHSEIAHRLTSSTGVATADRRKLLLLLWHCHIQEYRNQQFLCYSNDSGWGQLWDHVPWVGGEL
jgi:Sugar (and other) transporter